MRILFPFALVLSLILVCSCDSSEDLVIQNATLINPENGETEELNIRIADGIIQEITSETIRSSNTIDLKGSRIIPPLWDMHAHLHDSVETKLNGFKKYGVFGIRDMGIFKRSDPDYLYEYSSSLTQENIGYTIFPVGYIHNGGRCEVEEHYTIDSRSDLVKAISEIDSTGMGFFKIHNCFPHALIDDLVQLCSENEIKIVGHIPEGIDPLEFSKYRISSIEHMDSFIRGLFSRSEDPVTSFSDAIDILDGPYLDSIAINLKANRTYITPTLVTYENFVKSFPEEQQGPGMAILKRLQEYTKRLWESGIPILPGTDYPLGGAEAGSSLIRELELLVEAGIPVEEVIKMVTQNPSEYLGLHNGRIEEGSAANFIILNNNVDYLEALRNIESAVIDGTHMSL